MEDLLKVFLLEKLCKYCQEPLKVIEDEGIECVACQSNVHVRCLRRGAVPGGLNGDIFFRYECEDCSANAKETFARSKMSWLQIISLVLYHLQTKSTGLARKGFFHWRFHIAAFIDTNWSALLPPDVTKRKKKWTGTIAGTLSHFSSYVFLSGMAVINEPAFWTLNYPKLTPLTVSNVHTMMLAEKQFLKSKKAKVDDAEIFRNVLSVYIKNEEFLQTFDVKRAQASSASTDEQPPKLLNGETSFFKQKKVKLGKRKHSNNLTNLSASKLLKYSEFLGDDLEEKKIDQIVSLPTSNVEINNTKEIKLYDPFCHYNTSLNSISRLKGLSLQAKLTGGIRRELILSPFSEIYLKPYIRRDTETSPEWLRLMAELQLVTHKNDPNFVLPPRAPLDYTYVQPEHIPAINSLCNQYFWPGVDLTESLQYPDFSCVAIYKRLIVGFAFLVPNVSHTENYMSFLFTRPGWRNCGIAKFMVYHLIQTSLGKDITLHVSINNPALFLYQKFGFKVENVVMDFYDKYLRNDVKESKHAFFCRLER